MCVYHEPAQGYELQCALDDHSLFTIPGIVQCHFTCDCGDPNEIRVRLQALAYAAMVLEQHRHLIGAGGGTA